MSAALLPQTPESSGQSIDKWHRFRAVILLAVMLAGFAGLGIRLFYVQILGHNDFVRIAQSQQVLERPIKARRGGFYDQHGRPMCVSVPVKSVYIVPSLVDVDKVHLVAFALSRILRVDQSELQNGMLRRYDKQFMWAKRLVTEDEAVQVQKLGFKGVQLTTEYRRTFPQGAMAAHVIGWPNIDEQGQEGLEAVLERQLRGEDGFERLECDGLRRPILSENARFKPVRHGCDVRLTLDSEIQRFASDELDEIVKKYNPVSATVIVMETKTGRILALDNRPTYSPAFPARVKDPGDRLNRAVCAIYEPGSIFKPFVMSALIENHLGAPTDRIFCENGLYRYRGRRLRDVHPYGWLTISEVIEKSSNIGMAKVGLELGAERIYQIITAFGFGKSTGSGLPGELGGIITPFKSWSYYTVTSVPMGQEIAASPMQLVAAFNAIANGGLWVKPQVVDGISDADGKVIYQYTKPEKTHRVISTESARTLIDPMMAGVVSRGTAKSANFGDYPKFGKTGTAQKMAQEGGFSHSRFVSSFLCGAPVDDPKISVLVLVDEPRSGGAYYGGTVSGPPAARIVEKTLKYLGVEPPAGSGAAVARRDM